MVHLKRAVLLAGLVLGAFACRAEPPPTEQVSTMAVAESEAEPAAGGTTQAICPQQWTCGYVTWYASLAACSTACSSACVFDYHCRPGCACP